MQSLKIERMKNIIIQSRDVYTNDAERTTLQRLMLLDSLTRREKMSIRHACKQQSDEIETFQFRLSLLILFTFTVMLVDKKP